MIRISQIDDNFSIYKENITVFLGIGAGTRTLLDLFKYHKININYICDNNKENFGKVLEGIPVISPQHLQHLAQTENIVVQISMNNINNVEKQFESIGINKIISYKETLNILIIMIKLKLNKKNNVIQSIYKPYLIEKRVIEQKLNALNFASINNSKEQIVFICSLPKTGDHTIMYTLNKNNIINHMTHHVPESISKNFLNTLDIKVKIIIGIREPIIQSLSFYYQLLVGVGISPVDFIFESRKENFFENGGDFQDFFELCDNDTTKYFFINEFMNRFKENVLDISKYQFDTKKGYTIIKEGDIEVFVYQLEKMNDIVKEMSDWIGQNPFDKWVMGNEASDKWIANSYKQAQKEIKFSQEYFDRCYNDPWVQHFYSQEDIEKFKERWRPHIKD